MVVDRHPGRADDPKRLRLERAVGRATRDYLDAEDRVSALVRSLTDGRPLEVLAFGGEEQQHREYASVELDGYLVAVDSMTGRWVTATPAGLTVCLDGPT